MESNNTLQDENSLLNSIPKTKITISGDALIKEINQLYIDSSCDDGENLELGDILKDTLNSLIKGLFVSRSHENSYAEIN